MGGYSREPGQAVPIALKDDVSLDDSGYVISLNAGKARKADATDVIYGIALWSTESARHYAFDSKKRVYNDGDEIGDIAIARTGQVRVKLAPASSRSVAIAIGDELAVSADAINNGHAEAGTVDRSIADPSANGFANATPNIAGIKAEMLRRERVVGIAEEAIAADAINSHVLCSLRIHGGVGP